MKIIVIGASGTIGKAVSQRLEQAGHEVIRVGRKSGDFQANTEDRASVAALYKRIGSFDAVANAAGDVAFAPLAQLGAAEWELSLRSKFLGQVHLVQEALPYIRERGSFTLVSGVLSEVPILAGAAATVVNRAVEGFAMAAAAELPQGLRINVVSPTVLAESLPAYGAFFPGFEPVAGAKVAEAYLKAVSGVFTGRILKVGY